MRKHLYLITADERDDSLVGNVEFSPNRHANGKKNEQRPLDMRNRKTGDTWVREVVSLGYYDFEDEDDYKQNMGDVATKKLGEVDTRHLEKAGVVEASGVDQ